MSAIINLVGNIIFTGTSIIGIATIINKVGKFFKVVDQNNDNDGFKKGFDTFMLDSIEEINSCVESVSTIANNINKITLIMYDISLGNKYIKKDKDGKIILCNKSKVFKDKINELTSKLKKYEDQLSKIKKDKEPKETSPKEKDDNSSVASDDTYSDVSDDSSVSEDDDDEKKEEQFTLE
jgi:SMC interacting uncharacterized protein involved in chromosome segregation